MRRAAAACTFLLTLVIAESALADGGDQQYFILMRTPQVDPVPRFVVATQAPTQEQTVAYTGCDGHSYYLSPGDAASVSASIASQSTVQLQTAAAGVAPQDSSALCLIQASP